MTDETSNGAAAAATSDASAAGPQFTVQKIYIKDASFEAPNAPQIFQDEGQPQLQLNLQQKVGRLNAEAFEVVLTITLTCTIADKTAYLAEVQQAGVFGLRGFDPAQLDMMLGTYCPNVLFPYARQSIGDLVQHGGFPPFLLQPLNFEGIYAEQQRRRAEGIEGGDGAQTPAVGNA